MSPDALLKSTQEILQDHGNEITISPSCYFNLSLNICKTPIKTKLLVIPICEELRHDKTSRKKQKIIRAVILLVDYTYSEVCFNQDELTYSKFKENVLINVASYGFIPDEHCKCLHYVFALVAQNGLPSRVIYTESGLTPDLTAFIYKGVNIDIAAPANPDENEIAVSADAIRMMLNCCHGKSVILLMIQMIGLVYEIIKQLPNEKMRLCCITVLPYIYGDSGCGKTTISKAMYDYSYDNRFLSLATSTEAAILNKLSSVFSGVIIIDDIPHSTVNRCSRKDLDKLEPILRTYGDIGAEKSTANGQLASTSAWAVVTAEDLFVTTPSSILRLLTLHLDYGEVDFDAVEVLTENRISIDTFTICYLKWFFSKLLFDANGTTIADIPDLTILYASARKEILESYTNIREARIIDSHTQLIMYFEFFAEFFKLMNLSEEEITVMRTSLKSILFESAETQCLYLYETSLPFYINQALHNIIDSDSIGHYNTTDKLSNVQTGDNNVQAYRHGNILLFNTAQKKLFFSQIKQLIPNGKSVKDKEIIQALISMHIYLDAKTDSLINYCEKDNRIHINGKETRVMKILIKQKGENDE